MVHHFMLLITLSVNGCEMFSVIQGGKGPRQHRNCRSTGRTNVKRQQSRGHSKSKRKTLFLSSWSILGREEKCALTVMISIGSDRTLLLLQAIYAGKTPCSCPSRDSPHYQDLVDAGCLIQESGTAKYWSNLKTMKDFVNKLLTPYFNHQKEAYCLPSTQKSLPLDN